MLRNNGVSIRGPRAVDIVMLEHAGLSLLPMADQLTGSDVDCAAALVPSFMLEGCDDSDAASDEGQVEAVCESTGSGPPGPPVRA